MKTKRIKISELTPDDINANKGTQRGSGMLEKSLRDYGAGRSVLVDKSGRIIAGNKTIEAAGSIGLDEAVLIETDGTQVIVVKRTDLDLDSPQGRGLAIADNRVAEVGLDWDMEALEKIGEELDLGEFWFDDELPEIDFDSIDEDDEPTGDADAVPEVEDIPTSKRGDLWTLGDHRVLCGDSTSADDVARLMNGGRAGMAFTSPPYASQRTYDKSSGFKPLHPNEYCDWFDLIQSNVGGLLAEGGSWFVNIKAHCDEGVRLLYVLDLVLAHARKWGWRFVDELSWNRVSLPALYPNRFKNGFEPVFHFSKSKKINFFPKSVRHKSDLSKGYKTTDEVVALGLSVGFSEDGSNGGPGGVRSKNFDGALPSNVLNFSGVQHGVDHPAMFPVKLPAFFCHAYTESGAIVFDPFLGGGTTLIGAEQTERKCYGVEISPQYVDVIVKRWQDYTGKEATHEDGRTFAQVAEERADSEKEST